MLHIDKYLAQGTLHFTIRDYLYLPSMNFYYIPHTKQEHENAIWILRALQSARDFVERSFNKDPIIKITSGARPEKYNKYIKGGKSSQHIRLLAVDFKSMIIPSRDIRSLFLEKDENGLTFLQRIGLQMELNETSWTHLQKTKEGQKSIGFWV